MRLTYQYDNAKLATTRMHTCNQNEVELLIIISLQNEQNTNTVLPE